MSRKHVSRNALSQMNYKDLQEEHDDFHDYDIEEDCFQQMMKHQDDDQSEKHEFLQLHRHRSAFDKDKLADSPPKYQRTIRKTDLRKKIINLPQVKEDIDNNHRYSNPNTPEHDIIGSQTHEDDLIIPISQNQFENLNSEQDKIDSSEVIQDTRGYLIPGVNKFESLNC